MPTLANALLEGLRNHGAREIFGIPGDFVLPFFKTIEESNILPYFTLSHEPAVGVTQLIWGTARLGASNCWRLSRPPELTLLANAGTGVTVLTKAVRNPT
jgi:hypothetical protein